MIQSHLETGESVQDAIVSAIDRMNEWKKLVSDGFVIGCMKADSYSKKDLTILMEKGKGKR